MSSIGNTLNSINSSLLSEINSYYAASNTAAGTSTDTSTSSTAASSDTVDFSQVGKLFQELKQLQTSDPAEFKQVLSDAASKLQAAAQQQTDPTQASFLNNLADRFQQAASTGNLSALEPSSASSNGSYAPHGHHHHHGGRSKESSNTSQDPLSGLLGNEQTTQTSSTTSSLVPNNQ